MLMIPCGHQKTPEGLQKQIEKALEYTRKWRVTANVKKCAVVVACNEDKVNPVTYKWKWAEDELPIADQFTYLPWRRYVKIMLLGCTHSKSDRKG